MLTRVGDALHDVAQRARRFALSHRGIHRLSVLHRDRQPRGYTGRRGSGDTGQGRRIRRQFLDEFVDRSECGERQSADLLRSAYDQTGSSVGGVGFLSSLCQLLRQEPDPNLQPEPSGKSHV